MVSIAPIEHDRFLYQSKSVTSDPAGVAGLHKSRPSFYLKRGWCVFPAVYRAAQCGEAFKAEVPW